MNRRKTLLVVALLAILFMGFVIVFEISSTGELKLNMPMLVILGVAPLSAVAAYIWINRKELHEFDTFCGTYRGTSEFPLYCVSNQYIGYQQEDKIIMITEPLGTTTNDIVYEPWGEGYHARVTRSCYTFYCTRKTKEECEEYLDYLQQCATQTLNIGGQV